MFFKVASTAEFKTVGRSSIPEPPFLQSQLNNLMKKVEFNKNRIFLPVIEHSGYENYLIPATIFESSLK